MNDIDHLSVRPPYPMEKALGFDNPLPYLNSDKWKFHNSGIFYTFTQLNPLQLLTIWSKTNNKVIVYINYWQKTYNKIKN